MAATASAAVAACTNVMPAAAAQILSNRAFDTRGERTSVAMSALLVFKPAPGSYYIEQESFSAPPGTFDMLAPTHSSVKELTSSPGLSGRWRAARAGLKHSIDALVQRFPFVTLFLLVFVSNIAGSVFNIGYNSQLIVGRHMDPDQQAVFQNVALPIYNAIVYPLGIGAIIWLLVPLARCRRKLRAKVEVAAAELARARRRLLNLPFYFVCINFLCWLPGAVFFPLLVCGLGTGHDALWIWVQFILSFLVSALLTTAQTFFLLETYLIAYFYPDFFRDARPSDVQGVIRIPFGTRLLLLGSAVAVPLVALLLVALNIDDRRPDNGDLRWLAGGVALVGGLLGGFVFWMVGNDIRRWVVAHAAATEQIEMGNLDIHVREQRPDEWGQLTDRFNDMIAALARAKQMRETFGEFVGGPEIRDDIVQNFPGLEVQEEEVTVLFTDIRGFTRRTTGEKPARVGDLLNRFLTLSVKAVTTHGGMVNKFLGDGIMALFGVRQRRDDHADQAVAAARELLAGLAALNAELAKLGEPPLNVGIGIHTGPALIGCFGVKGLGRKDRREFSAIGETVNLAQRLEQLTKVWPGPILISEQTRAGMRKPLKVRSYGAVQVPGYDNSLVVHQVKEQ
jgi:adenylate cyclase